RDTCHLSLSHPLSAPSPPSSGAQASRTYAVYYVGTDPRERPVLFREFHRSPVGPSAAAPGSSDVLTRAVRDAITEAALDPDYVSPWAGRATLDHASYDAGAGTLVVALDDGAPTQRPEAM